MAKLNMTGVVVGGCKSDFTVSVPTQKEPLIIQAKPKGALRINQIFIMDGDTVEVEVDATNPSRGLITRRILKK